MNKKKLDHKAVECVHVGWLMSRQSDEWRHKNKHMGRTISNVKYTNDVDQSMPCANFSGRLPLLANMTGDFQSEKAGRVRMEKKEEDLTDFLTVI